MRSQSQRFLFFAALLLCTALRVYLKLFSVDPSTGFYQNTKIATVFHWILGICCLALLILGFFSKLSGSSLPLHLPVRGYLALSGVFALIFAGSTLLDTVTGLLTVSTNVPVISLLGSLLLSMVGIFCLLIAPAVTGFLFLAAGLKGTGRWHGGLLLMPVLWQTALLLRTFMDYTLMRSVSDQKLMIVALILIVPFLLANGRMLSGVDPKKGARQLRIFALPFSLVAVSLSLGVIVAWFAGRTVGIGPSIFAAFFYLSMGLYAIFAVFSLQSAEEM